MDTPVSLKRPTAISLSRVSDRVTFLYVDRCRIVQDDNGIGAQVFAEDGRLDTTTYLPAATISCLLLGPGTTLTHAAAGTLARAGCLAAFVGAGGVRSYSTFGSIAHRTELLQRQAVVATDPEERVQAARWMYAKRFPGPLPDGLTIEQLRGLEGARVKAIYSLAAKKHRITRWRRNTGTGNFGDPDPVNVALNYANAALYGVVGAAVQALGLATGLGIIHEGQRSAFVLDIADLYKAELTIPLAFKQWKSEDPGREVMRALRKEFTLLRFIPRIVDDIYGVLGKEVEPEADDGWEVEDLRLWSPGGSVVAGYNYDGLMT